MILSDLPSIPRGLTFAKVTTDELAVDENAMTILEGKSKDIWLLSSDEEEPLFLAGVVQTNFLGEAFMWFMMCEAFPKNLLHNVRGIKMLMRELTSRYPFVITAVEVGCVEAERFAFLFRWKPSGPPYEVMGRTYRKYKVGA